MIFWYILFFCFFFSPGTLISGTSIIRGPNSGARRDFRDKRPCHYARYMHTNSPWTRRGEERGRGGTPFSLRPPAHARLVLENLVRGKNVRITAPRSRQYIFVPGPVVLSVRMPIIAVVWTFIARRCVPIRRHFAPTLRQTFIR